MVIDNYRGVKLKATAGKRDRWGHVHVWVNGHDWGWHLGSDETAYLKSLHGYVDQAIDDDPLVNGRRERYEDWWRPGYKVTCRT